MKRIILTLIIIAFTLLRGNAQEGAAKSALAEGDYQAAIKLYQVAIATCSDESKSADLYNSITNAQKCEELLGQANEAYKKKKYSEAKKLYQSILKYNPSDKFSKKRISSCSNNTSQPKQEKTVQHEYVDLGLSVMWATCNIGASKPEDYGNKYAWGETKTKSEYTKNNSKTYDKYMKSITGDTQYDAATANWGGKWRLPTKEEFKELINKCTWNYTIQGGKQGYKVTGPNGNSIFLPIVDYWSGSNLYSDGSFDSDMSAYFNKKIYYTKDRHFGKFVRPVCDKDVKKNNTTSQQSNATAKNTTTKQEYKPSKGTQNGHEYVDLGLSVKWATCNVGASSPEEYGNYYAWGETETKSTYPRAQGNNPSYLSDFSGNAKYDAARANWGGNWRTPTYNECQELFDKCKWEWTKQNEKYGYKITGPNGNSIFLPAAGYMTYRSNNTRGYACNYWTSTPGRYNDWGIRLYAGDYKIISSQDRGEGMSIRPVIK